MNDHFIKLDDGTELRRTVLESSKGSLHILRSYQQLLEVRSKKKTMLKSLRRELKELTMLVNHLEQYLPTLTKAEVKELQPVLKDIPAPKSKKGAEPKVVSGPAVYVGKPEKDVKKHESKKVFSREEIKQEREKSELEKLEEKLQAVEKKLKKL